MKRRFQALLCTIAFINLSCAQDDSIISLTKKAFMIPMRDGVKLFTLVYYPTNNSKPVPIVITRTPYGVDGSVPDDSAVDVSNWAPYHGDLARAGYILVFQDIR